MNVVIKETGERKALEYISNERDEAGLLVDGVNHASDYIGNQGALADGQFDWSDDLDAYICTQGTYDWWLEMLEKQTRLDDRMRELREAHGQAVDDCVSAVEDADLEQYVDNALVALDEQFGEEVEK